MQIIQSKSIKYPPPYTKKEKINAEKSPPVINYLDGSKPWMCLGLKNLNLLASLNYVIQDLICTLYILKQLYVCTIISVLYILNPLFEGKKLLFKGLFS